MKTSSTRSLGIIGDRFEVLIATAPQPLSRYQIEMGVKAETGVWMRDVASGHCCWQSTVEESAKRDPATVGLYILGDIELSRQLATMIAEAAK